MKQPVLFLLLIGIILIIMGYLELFFESKQIEKKVEYRFVPRNVYDQIESNNLKDQFSNIFDSNDVRLRTNLI